MPNQQVVGAIPEFTSDESVQTPVINGQETAPESGAETPELQAETEKETQTEPSSEQQPAETDESQLGDNTGTAGDYHKELIEEVDGLREARRELISELKDLRGQKRELKQEEIQKVDEQIDELEDVNPDDVNIIDRIARQRGYASKKDVEQMFYAQRKQDESDKFFQEFPEYSDKNDPDRKKFDRLLQEVSLYKEPSEPKMYSAILRRAHSAIAGSRTTGDSAPKVIQQQVKIAGMGSGGAQRSSSTESFSPEKRTRLLQGGWSKEEVDRMEQRQSSV